MNPSRRIISSFNFGDLDEVELQAFSDSKMIELRFSTDIVQQQSYRGRRLESEQNVNYIQWTSEKQHAQEMVEIIQRIAGSCETIE